MKRVKSAPQGAALVEYALLAGLISVVAIVGVYNLGEKVSDVFSDVTLEIAEVTSGGSNTDEELGPAPTFTWEGDGSDSLPSGVTAIPNGWLMDIDEVISPDADRSSLRFDAWISQDGSFEIREGWPGSASSYSINVRSYWERGGETPLPIAQKAESATPSGVLTAYGETTGGIIPSDATGIRFERIFGCNSGSVCTNGAFKFNIDVYPRP